MRHQFESWLTVFRSSPTGTEAGRVTSVATRTCAWMGGSRLPPVAGKKSAARGLELGEERAFSGLKGTRLEPRGHSRSLLRQESHDSGRRRPTSLAVLGHTPESGAAVPPTPGHFSAVATRPFRVLLGVPRSSNWSQIRTLGIS